MKIKLSLLLLIFSFASLFSQNFEKLVLSKKDKPTVVINDDIIANWELLNSIPKENIKSIEVMKSTPKSSDHIAPEYKNLSQYGLILCKANISDLSIKTQQEIREFFKTKNETKIYVDGFLLKDDKLKIATKSIVEVDIIKPNETDFNDNLVINIWTLQKDERMGIKNSTKSDALQKIK